MAGGFPIVGVVSGNGVEANTDNELLAALSKTLGKAGLAALIGQVHDGAAGLGKVQRPIYASIENRLAVGMDNILWDDVFTGANINLSRYNSGTATYTTVQTGGGITFNNGGSIATSAGSFFRTYRTFPIFGNFPTTIDFAFSLALVPQAQNIIEIGLGLPAGSFPFAPTDGLYMQIDTAGALQLVANFNGTLTTSGAITFTWTANRFYHAEIVAHRDRIELWIDGVLYGVVLRSAASSVGQMSMLQSMPLFTRMVNNAATTGAQKLNIANWTVVLNDVNLMRPMPLVMGGLCLNGANLPDGVVAGGSANITNSAAPASATLSNTAAGYTTKDGNFQWAAVAGAETDYALFAYQVPAASVTQPGKNMFCRGVRIELENMGAANSATVPTTINWYLGFGATAVSMVTADSATAATRAARRIAIGSQSIPINAVVGQNVTGIDIDFDPIMIEPGTFVHTIARIISGAATASQILRGTTYLKTFYGD